MSAASGTTICVDGLTQCTQHAVIIYSVLRNSYERSFPTGRRGAHEHRFLITFTAQVREGRTRLNLLVLLRSRPR